jgi:hypothetical protein
MTLKLDNNLSGANNNNNEINSTKFGFVSWFFNYLYSKGHSSVKFNESKACYSPLEESIIDENWIYIESDKERLEQLKYDLQKEGRQKELEDLAKKKKFSAKLHENWRVKIEKVFETLSPEELHWSQTTLDSNTRYSIIGNVVKQFQDLWLGKSKPKFQIQFYWGTHLEREILCPFYSKHLSHLQQWHFCPRK